MVSYSIKTHLCAHSRFVNCKSPAESTAFVRAIELGEFDPFELGDERCGFVERQDIQFAVAAKSEFAETVATLVETYAVREAAARRLDLQHVGEELT